MIKLTSILTALIISVLMLTSCTSNQAPAEPTPSPIAEHYTHDSIYFDYTTNHYKFRLPLYWQGKFMAIVSKGREDFYEINSYDTDESGLLFSIHEYADKSFENELTNYKLLCYDKRFELYYVMTTPETPTYAAEYENEYKELEKGVHIVTATFRAEL